MTTDYLGELAKAKAKVDDLEAKATQARNALYELIRDYPNRAVRQSQVARATGYTREHIRIITDPTKRKPATRRAAP